MASDIVLHSIPESELHQTCTTEFLANLAGRLKEWKILAPYLGIDEVRIEEIELEHESNYEHQKYQLLLEWQKKTGIQKATYDSLVEALRKYEQD